MKYFATTTKSNKRVEFTASTLRGAKVQAGKELIYAGESVTLYEDDGMGGLLKSVKKDEGKWEDSFI